MGLIIALDEKNLAKGRLFWDDGENTGKYHYKNLPMQYIETFLDAKIENFIGKN